MALVSQAKAEKVSNAGTADRVDTVRRIAGIATTVASQAITKEIVQSPEVKEEKGKLAGRGLFQSTPRAKEKVKVEKAKEKASKEEKERKEPRAKAKARLPKAKARKESFTLLMRSRVAQAQINGAKMTHGSPERTPGAQEGTQHGSKEGMRPRSVGRTSKTEHGCLTINGVGIR